MRLKAGGHDRINVQNNPVNLVDPYGLRFDHWSRISIDYDKGTISYNGEIFAFRDNKGNWQEADPGPNAKTWKQKCPDDTPVEFDIAQEIVDKYTKDDWIDLSLSGVSLTAAAASFIVPAGWPAWAVWGLGLGADSASAYRSNNITQLDSSAAGFPLFGSTGRVIGTGLATYNFISNTN